MSKPYDPTDRRPIATRSRKASQLVAGLLVRGGISANTISLLGMVPGVFGGVAFALTATSFGPERLWWILGAACVQLRLLANMFDGMVAIASGTASANGELYNEVPDRVSDTAILIGLGYAAFSDLTLGYLAACAAMFVAYIRATGKAAGAHHEFCGPFAKPHRMFLVTLTALWCALTPVSWQAFPSPGILAGVPAAVLALITAGSLFTALRRLRKISASLHQTA